MTEYVIVCDENDVANVAELPVEADGTLTMQTLNAFAEGARGLRYKNPTTGTYRIVALDDDGKSLKAPAEGWGETKYFVIAPKVEESNKRKHDDSSPGRIKSARLEDVDPDFDPDFKSRDLIITSIPLDVTAEQLREALKQYGEIDFLELKIDMASGISRGYGFVRYKSQTDQDALLKKQSIQVGTGTCGISIPISRQKTSTSAATSSVIAQPQYTKKLFVGNLDMGSTKESLAAAFNAEAKKINQQAEVTDVFIPYGSKGFAFVTFNSAVVAQKLLAIKNFTVDGHQVFVNPAVVSEKKREKEFMRTFGNYPQGAHYYPGTAAAYDGAGSFTGSYNSPTDPYNRYPSQADSYGFSGYTAAVRLNRPNPWGGGPKTGGYYY